MSTRKAVASLGLWSFMAGCGAARTNGAISRWFSNSAERSKEVVISPAPYSVSAYHGDNLSSGVFRGEEILKPSNVTMPAFGKLLDITVDGQVYAQPLYLAGVQVPASGKVSPARTTNVVYVATEHDSLYAIDAVTYRTIWKTSFLTQTAAGADVTKDVIATPLPATDLPCGDLIPEIGITGTPAIDETSGTLYVVTKEKDLIGGAEHYIQKLHAVDVATGAEKLGGPTVIADTSYSNGAVVAYNAGPTVAGDGAGTVNGTITFDALRENQRAALTLASGHVYVAWASHCDQGPYHGWILGFDATSLQLDGVFNSTPNGTDGGIWQSAGRIAVDATGDLYVVTGNGDFDTTLDSDGMPGKGDYGDSILRISVDPGSDATHPNVNGWGLKVVDYFTPSNQADLVPIDADLGSGGPILLPDTVGTAAHPHLMVAGGKDGRIFLLDRDALGHFAAAPAVDNVVQVTIGAVPPLFSTPSFYEGALLVAGNGGTLSRVPLVDGQLGGVESHSADKFSWPGATTFVSANAAGDDGVVWCLERATATLRAYDPLDLSHELYRSDEAPDGRDALSGVVKFSSPLVASGLVFVGTPNSLVVFGPTAPRPAATAKPTTTQVPARTLESYVRSLLARPTAQARTMISLAAPPALTATKSASRLR